MTDDDDRAPPLSERPQVQWFHGSPTRLDVLREGSTVTPVLALAKAFSHKPKNVNIEMRESDGRRHVMIRHDGTQTGVLYRVLVQNPEKDLQQHPGSTGAKGEEMLATRDLPIEWIEDLPLAQSYEFVEQKEL